MRALGVIVPVKLALSASLADAADKAHPSPHRGEGNIDYSDFSSASAPEASALPGESSIDSDFTTPSSTTMQ